MLWPTHPAVLITSLYWLNLWFYFHCFCLFPPAVPSKCSPFTGMPRFPTVYIVHLLLPKICLQVDLLCIHHLTGLFLNDNISPSDSGCLLILQAIYGNLLRLLFMQSALEGLYQNVLALLIRHMILRWSPCSESSGFRTSCTLLHFIPFIRLKMINVVLQGSKRLKTNKTIVWGHGDI